MQGGGGHSNNNNRNRHHSRPNNGGGNNFNRPRKNYPQLREKYMNQARDMLAQGDRVMAEYYFQHADHCYRMMMEEGSHNPRPQNQQQTQGQENANNQAGNEAQHHDSQQLEDNIPENTTALPAFLTMGFPNPENPQPVQAPNWEENQ